MSHYAKIATKFTCSETLKSALIALGFTGNQVEIHNTPIEIGEGEKANVVIRANNGFYKDIGWLVDPNGKKSKAFIDNYNVSNKIVQKLGVQNWTNKLNQEYAAVGIIEKAKQQRKPYRRVEQGDKVLVFVGA